MKKLTFFASLSDIKFLDKNCYLVTRTIVNTATKYTSLALYSSSAQPNSILICRENLPKRFGVFCVFHSIRALTLEVCFHVVNYICSRNFIRLHKNTPLGAEA